MAGPRAAAPAATRLRRGRWLGPGRRQQQRRRRRRRRLPEGGGRGGGAGKRRRRRGRGRPAASANKRRALRPRLRGRAGGAEKGGSSEAAARRGGEAVGRQPEGESPARKAAPPLARPWGAAGGLRGQAWRCRASAAPGSAAQLPEARCLRPPARRGGRLTPLSFLPPRPLPSLPLVVTRAS